MPITQYGTTAEHSPARTGNDRAARALNPRHRVERLAYSPSEVAEALGASRAWVYLRLDDGTIPSVKLQGRRFIRADIVHELLAGGDAA